MEEPVTGWRSTHSFYKLETVDGDERLKVDHSILFCNEPTRKQLLLRRIATVIEQEEKRLFKLTDSEAIAELDALKFRESQLIESAKKLDRFDKKD